MRPLKTWYQTFFAALVIAGCLIAPASTSWAVVVQIPIEPPPTPPPAPAPAPAPTVKIIRGGTVVKVVRETPPVQKAVPAEFTDPLLQTLSRWTTALNDVPRWTDDMTASSSIEDMNRLLAIIAGQCGAARACPPAILIAQKTIEARIAKIERAEQAESAKSTQLVAWLALLFGLAGTLAAIAQAVVAWRGHHSKPAPQPEAISSLS